MVLDVFNDICASLWFTYLLLFFQKVLRFDSSDAGVAMLAGQLADGIATTLIGLIADKVARVIPLCGKYGKRKSWHLLGSLCVAVSFPFIWLPSQVVICECNGAHRILRLLYYIAFIVVFQFGWAAVQINHLSLITDLTACENKRTTLTAVRYGATVISSIGVYVITWIFLGMGCQESDIDDDDKDVFRNIMLVCWSIGMVATFLFHILIKEKSLEKAQTETEGHKDQKSKEVANVDGSQQKSILWWIRQPKLYIVAVIYMATRLFLNLSQAYIPFYLQDSPAKKQGAGVVAQVPLIMFAASFVASWPTKLGNKYLGRPLTWLAGAAGVELLLSLSF